MSYVYLMVSQGRYKIGKADDVAERLRTFQTADPEIRLVTSIRTTDAYGLEAALHRRYRHQRLWADREWFALQPAQVKHIQSMGDNPRFWHWPRLRLHPRHPLRLFRRAIRLVPHLVAALSLCVLIQPGALRLVRLPRLTVTQQVVLSAVAWLFALTYLWRSFK